MRGKVPEQVTSAAGGEASAAADLAALADDLRQRAARDDAEFAEGGAAGLRRFDQPLGNESAAVMIAAVRQLAARLLQDDVHVRFGSLTQLCHDARARVACSRKHTQTDVV